MLDMVQDAAMVDEGLARQLVNLVQKLRKKGQLVPTEAITVYYEVDKGSDVEAVLSCQSSFIESSLRVPIRPASTRPASAEHIVQESCQVIYFF